MAGDESAPWPTWHIHFLAPVAPAPAPRPVLAIPPRNLGQGDPARPVAPTPTSFTGARPRARGTEKMAANAAVERRLYRLSDIAFILRVNSWVKRSRPGTA